MARILFLYDTKEADLARDFKDFLAELDILVNLIPLSPDLGLTLDQKEKKYFDSADGAIFLITPGSERGGVLYPSPSVTHELGQAKIKFRAKPEAVICLVDENCKLPAIEQITFIQLNRQNIRSAVSGLTQLIRDLKGAGFFKTAPIQVKPPSPPPMPLESVLKSLTEAGKGFLLMLSNTPSGVMNESEFSKSFSGIYGLKTQDMNFLKRDLIRAELITNPILGSSLYFVMADLGWEVVRVELKKREDTKLLNMLGSTPALERPGGPPQQRALSGAVRLQALLDKTDPSDKK